jgi:TonB family protein
VSGIPALGQAAVDAMKDWKFKPFIRNGNPVEASSNILFDFVFCDTVPEPSNLLSSGAPNGATSKGIKVVRLSQNAAKQLILKKVEPVYPPLAKLGRVQGKVLIFAVIGKDGTMQYLKLIGGHPLLTQASLEAVKQWRYRPFTIDGEAIEAQTVITIDFTFN